ncbi:MAG: flavodoxin family protein [Pygmaiobacter massiliensis]|nr:flavodoxin family protein [Pygmaiobacter massiliensis]
MKQKVLVICSSLRPNSNSELLAQQFAKGAQEAGHSVEILSLKNKQLQFCTGCMACLKTPHCVLQDDANAIVEKMRTAQVLCFAAPVYYYGLPGQLKTLLDRANPLYSCDYSFRDIYLLTASAELPDSASDGSVNSLQEWIRCFEQARLAGVVQGGGANDPGEMALHTDKLQKAYEMGKNI